MISLLLLFFGGLALFLGRSAPSPAAEIYSEGQLIRTVRLDEDQTFTIEGSFGTNTITVSGGKIAVTAATCPDHICVNRGYCDGGMDIVCLPNRLVIRFTGGTAPDGIIG